MKITQRSDYTFKYNQKLGRHGWLRLTPAYSVKLVSEIINTIPKDSFILDPFSGTATTGLVAAEHGLSAHCLDINQFLIWFGKAKCRNYPQDELRGLRTDIQDCLEDCKELIQEVNWIPAIHNITRWWCQHTLKILSSLRQALINKFGEPKENDVSALAWIAFCRLVIETSSASFNHVSMSFDDKVTTYQIDQIVLLYQAIIEAILESISKDISDNVGVYFADSREPKQRFRPQSVNEVKYSHVITSPPYPNRISYVRELRPYMYWTKFLNSAHEAGELDWQAIGGTWGIATSRLQDWVSNGVELPSSLKVVSDILETKEKNALLMANYIWKYFHDMYLHLDRLRQSLRTGAKLTYIVGNSSFYGIQVHTEQLLAASLRQLGYTNIGSKIIRKRNSKKELYEYCVRATWKAAKRYKPS